MNDPLAASKTLPSVGAPRRARRSIDSLAARVVIQTMFVALFLAAWEAGARAGIVSPFLVGSPAGIWKILVISVQNGSLLDDTWTTLFEAMLGFVLGTVAGSVLGLGL